MSPADEQTNYASTPLSGREKAELQQRLDEVRGRIRRALERAGRSADEVTLIAISKTHPLTLVRAGWEAGLRIFGENRIQEALAKIEAMSEPAQWHLIGHVQRNKAAQAVGRFDLIHSVDSARLIEALEERAATLGITQRILLQLNVSGETSKFGAAPADLPQLLEALTRAPHLRGEGLMTIPPYHPDPEASRPYFHELRRIMAGLRETPGFQPRHLSMGMSGDFETAIEEGATLIRVGTAIFGER